MECTVDVVLEIFPWGLGARCVGACYGWALLAL